MHLCKLQLYWLIVMIGTGTIMGVAIHGTKFYKCSYQNNILFNTSPCRLGSLSSGHSRVSGSSVGHFGQSSNALPRLNCLTHYIIVFSVVSASKINYRRRVRVSGHSRVSGSNVGQSLISMLQPLLLSVIHRLIIAIKHHTIICVSASKSNCGGKKDSSFRILHRL